MTRSFEGIFSFLMGSSFIVMLFDSLGAQASVASLLLFLFVAGCDSKKMEKDEPTPDPIKQRIEKRVEEAAAESVEEEYAETGEVSKSDLAHGVVEVQLALEELDTAIEERDASE